MNFLEKDLEEIIFTSPKEVLKERGLSFTGKAKRQLRIGNYGIADLVTFERSWDFERWKGGNEEVKINVYPKLNITVYELKKDKIGISALLQAVSYARGIEDFLNARDIHAEIKIVLIGRELDTSGSFPYLESFMDSLSFYTYHYGIDGLRFKKEYGYELVDKGF